MDPIILYYSAYLLITFISEAPVNIGRTISKIDDVVLIDLAIC